MYLREKATGKVINVSEAEAVNRLTGNWEIITREEYKEHLNSAPITASLGSIAGIRRVHAEVSPNVYRLFCTRLKDEGVPSDRIGEAFSKLIEEYAYGAILHRPGKAHAVGNGADYMSSHRS